MQIYLPNSARLQNIENFLSRIDPTNTNELRLSMHPKWVNVHPIVLAITASLGNLCRESRGNPIVAEIPKHSSARYIARMKLFEHLNIETGIRQVEHESAGRFIPLTQISSKEDLSAFLIDMIPLLHAPLDKVDPIRYVVSELVRNSMEHAFSAHGAFVCAQYYQDTQCLALGVADLGVGVQTSIRRSHVCDSDISALNLALRPGITGTTSRIGGNEYNAGGGLFFTKSIACASNNYFVIASGNAMFKLRKTPKTEHPKIQADPSKDLATWRSDLPILNGTAVGIEVSLPDNATFKDLMKSINSAYELDVKSHKRDKYKKPRFL